MLAPTGKPFTTSSIGGAIATRAIMADLRAGGDIIGGPAPFAKTDRSRFLRRSIPRWWPSSGSGHSSLPASAKAAPCR